MQCRATRYVTSNHLGQYCLFRTEIDEQEVLQYAKCNEIYFRGSCNVTRHVAQCRATRCATWEHLMEYRMVRAETCFSGVLAYAEYNGIGFKVVAATSRDTMRDMGTSHGIPHVPS